jgi:CheY-like chemotaxis protein
LLTSLMGGELTASSRVGTGSCFSVRLFLPSVAHPKMPVDAPAPRHITGYAGEPKRVLVVDDAPADRQLLSDVLEPLGFTVMQAASGVEALRVASQFAPDLILLDIDMPEIDGWETARLLRANRISMAPVLIVSANAFDSDLCNDVGVAREDFLIKPFRIDDLLERVRTKLDLVWATQDDGVDYVETGSSRTMLPEASLLVLRQLGDMGYVRGILEKLEELDLLDTRYAPVTKVLRGCVQRFDLQGFARVLEEGSV